MLPSNSSILGSEPAGKATSSKRICLWTAVWFLVVLVIFDVGINLAFPYPSDPMVVEVPAIRRYFDYGRSIEGKLIRRVGPTDETSGSLAQAGWLANIPPKDTPAPPAPGHILVTFYGMSFAGNIAEELHRQDPTIDIRLILGPGAPPSHSFESFMRDRKGHPSDIVVFVILASSVAGLDSMSGAMLLTDSPAPFTFPLFSLENGHLTKIEPLVVSLSAFRETMKDPERRRAYRDQLYRHDKFISPFMFEANLLDESALIRLFRRAYVRSFNDNRMSMIHDQNGFLPGWDKIPVLKAMVVEFAESARADGRMPIVILVQNRGYGDHLHRMLGSTLVERDIPFLSTHDIAPATMNANFLSDGHFTEDANRRITLKLREYMKSRFGMRKP